MPAPLAHLSGRLNAVPVPLATGMTAVLMARWDPDRALDLIERHQVTFMIGPPTFFVSLRGASGFRSERVRSMRLISSGGAGVTPGFVAETAALFGATVKRTYGSTEAPTVTTSHDGDDPERARNTDGRPTGSVQVRIGEGGEVLVRGPELFVGYTDPDRTAEAVTPDGWFRTGDVGRLDPDGWLTIVGRIKDVIIRGGENIAAAEVEAVLEAHPSVDQAVVVGRPHARLGEQVCAYVVCRPGETFDLERCQVWFAEQEVARYKTPEAVVVVDELPLLAAGKVDRAELRRRASSG
jgi:cyclohexanecarboxylate-CoA ligase